MDNTALILGVLLMATGSCLWIAAIFRAMTHTWTLGVAELWLLPVVGFGLILLGMWMFP